MHWSKILTLFFCQGKRTIYLSRKILRFVHHYIFFTSKSSEKPLHADCTIADTKMQFPSISSFCSRFVVHHQKPWSSSLIFAEIVQDLSSNNSLHFQFIHYFLWSFLASCICALSFLPPEESCTFLSIKSFTEFFKRQLQRKASCASSLEYMSKFSFQTSVCFFMEFFFAKWNDLVEI